MDKEELRKEIKHRLCALDDGEIRRQSAAACGKIAGLPEFIAAGCMLAYMPIKGEADPKVIVDMARDMGKSVAYPKCEGNELALYIPNDDEAFVIGAYGIIEPDAARSRRITTADVDIAIIPGVAFDKKCQRLGRGKGYYDRLLADAGLFTVGLALNGQIADDVPTEPYDKPLSCIAFEKGIIC